LRTRFGQKEFIRTKLPGIRRNFKQMIVLTPDSLIQKELITNTQISSITILMAIFKTTKAFYES
jgi:hypothetical protein